MSKEEGKGMEAPPMFMMMPSREVLHRLIIRACEFKKAGDIDF